MGDFKRLMAFEWRKLWKAKSFRVCIVVILAIGLLNVVSNKIVYEIFKEDFDAKKQVQNDGQVNISLTVNGEDILENEDSDDDEEPSIADLVSVPYSAHDAAKTCICNGDLILLVAVFTGIFAAHDFDSGVMKNVVARGYRREVIIGAKFVVTWFGCLTLMLLFFGFTYVATGLLMSFGGGFTLAEVMLLLSQFLLFSAQFSFVFCVAMLIKKVGFSIAIGILMPDLLGLGLSLVELLIKRFTDHTVSVSKWWLSGITGQLISDNIANKTVGICAACAAVYLLVFFGLSIFANRRMEV